MKVSFSKLLMDNSSLWKKDVGLENYEKHEIIYRSIYTTHCYFTVALHNKGMYSNSLKQIYIYRIYIYTQSIQTTSQHIQNINLKAVAVYTLNVKIINKKAHFFQKIVIYVTTDWVSFEVKTNVHIFPKSTGIVITVCLGITKCFQNNI